MIFHWCRKRQTNDRSTNYTQPTDVTTSVNAVEAINDYLAQEDPQATIGKLIKFSKGQYQKGADGEIVPHDTLVTVACDMVLVGFVRWHDNKPAEHKLVRIASGAPLYRREALGYLDKDEWPTDAKGAPRDPWQEAMYVPVMDADGEVGTFTTSSVTGIKSVQRLLRRYATHAKRHPNDYPLVKLGVDYLIHTDKAIGKVFIPYFEPAGYVDKAEFCEALEAVGVTVDVPAAATLPKPKDEINDAIPF